MTDRRQFLKCLGLAALSPQYALAGLAGEKCLRLRNLHTGETCRSVFWAEGQWLSEGLAELNRLLRDHRADQATDMDPALLALLHRVQASLGHGGEIQVISGYRSPATNERLRAQGQGVARHSLHTTGQAVDIRLPGVALRDLRRAALAQAAGGVGFYPTNNFVHLDTGRVRRW